MILKRILLALSCLSFFACSMQTEMDTQSNNKVEDFDASHELELVRQLALESRPDIDPESLVIEKAGSARGVCFSYNLSGGQNDCWPDIAHEYGSTWTDSYTTLSGSSTCRHGGHIIGSRESGKDCKNCSYTVSTMYLYCYSNNG